MERRKLLVGIVSAAGLGAMAVIGATWVRNRDRDSGPVTASTRPRASFIKVYKSPTCSCCTLWAEHLQQNGFQVEIINEEDLEPVKQRLGVPFGKGSCHTGEVEGYMVEGHVPAADIHRLLSERPRAKGLVVPAMPIGSPGMEIPDAPAQEFTVELVNMDGGTEIYSRHPGTSA